MSLKVAVFQTDICQQPILVICWTDRFFPPISENNTTACVLAISRKKLLVIL